MKLSEILPSVFADGDDPDIQVTTKKYSQFPQANGPGIQGVGLKGGSNVRFDLTTDAIEVNPDITFRSGGQPLYDPDEIANITNQLEVNRFLATELSKLEFSGVEVSSDPPVIITDGQLWYDDDRLELFVSYQDAWISTSPLESRVEAGEALQAEILGRVEAGEKNQESIVSAVDDGIREQARLRGRIGDLEANSATQNDLSEYLGLSGGTANKMKGNLYLGGFFIAGLGEPTAGNHAATMQYVDNQVASIKQSGALDPYASNFIMPGYGLTGAGDSVGGEGVFKFVRMDGQGFTANPKDSSGICFDIRKYSSFFADLRTKLDVGTCYGTGIIYVWDETVSEETGLIAKYRVMNRGDYDTQGGGSFLIYGDQLMARSSAPTTHTYRIELVGF